MNWKVDMEYDGADGGCVVSESSIASRQQQAGKWGVKVGRDGKGRGLGGEEYKVGGGWVEYQQTLAPFDWLALAAKLEQRRIEREGRVCKGKIAFHPTHRSITPDFHDFPRQPPVACLGLCFRELRR